MANQIWWNDEKVAFLRERYEAGVTIPDIRTQFAEHFDCDPGYESIRGAIGRHCADLREKFAKESRETAEWRHTTARRMIEEGYPISAVAEHVGVTKRTIYDWVSIEGRTDNSISVRAIFESYLNRIQPTPVPDDPIIDGGKTITELEANECRWPIGKDADGAFRFCGCQFHRPKTAKHPRPYCDAHAKGDLYAKENKASVGRPRDPDLTQIKSNEDDGEFRRAA